MGDPIAGARIKAERLAKGLTQAEFAEAVGLETGQAVSNLERGKTGLTPERAKAIADYTKKPIGWYLDPLADEMTIPVDTPAALLRSTADGVTELLWRIRRIETHLGLPEAESK